jgi:hypothetical protein
MLVFLGYSDKAIDRIFQMEPSWQIQAVGHRHHGLQQPREDRTEDPHG